MAKYDDFGRPVYETAEEYNRAHGTGGSARRHYNQEENTNQYRIKRESAKKQTAAQRYATRTGSNKAKPMVVGLVTFFIVMIFTITFSIFNMAGEIYEEAYREPDYKSENIDENYESSDVPLPDGFETFFYNGQYVTLPTTCKEIATLGYDVAGYELTEMVPVEFWETISLVDKDGYTIAMISVRNNTEDEIPFEKCTVDYFYIDNPARYDQTLAVPDFVFGNELTLESSYQEVEEYFGEPYYHYEDHSDEDYLYDSYQWEYYGVDERHFVMVNFVNGEMLDVSIEKEIYEE